MGHVVYQPGLGDVLKPDASSTAWGNNHPARVVRIAGDEAHHAVRVKRLAVGDQLELRDGQGLAARATIESIARDRDGRWSLDARVLRAAHTPRTHPVVHVRTAAAKGERLDAMVDGLSQIGAASWGALSTMRSVVEPRSGKLERLTRVAEESLKQCGRAWLMEIAGLQTLEQVLHNARGILILADRHTLELREAIAQQRSSGRGEGGCCEWWLLVGPEGGWTDEERNMAQSRGAVLAGYGPHVLRIETAALVGAGLLIGLAG